MSPHQLKDNLDKKFKKLGYHKLPINNVKSFINLSIDIFLGPILDEFENKYGKSYFNLTAHDFKEITSLIFDITNKDLVYKTELEKLSVDIVLNELAINEDEIDIDAKLLTITEKNIYLEPDNNLTIYNIASANDLYKRRLINAITHGGAWSYTKIYHLYKDQLPFDDNTQKVLEYDIYLACALISWLVSFESINNTEKQMACGKSKIDENLKVVSGAINFPILINENFKGVFEYLSKFGLPKVYSIAVDTVNQTDKFEYEIFDMIIGTVIWKNLYNILINYDNVFIKHVLIKIFELDDKSFFNIINDIITGNADNEIKIIIDNIRDEIY